MENSKARVLMLAVSGVLFGATAFGWFLHSMPGDKAADAPTSVAAVTPTVATPATQVATVQEPAREVYPATTMEEAQRAARASLRQDPFGAIAAAPVARQERHTDFVPPPPNTRLIDPPPANPDNIDVQHLPPPPSVNDVNMAQEARHERLSADDVRLVGVIDNKAIFRINRDVAAQLGLQRSYTVGKGETLGGTLEVEKIGRDSATVRDGTSVATKELGPIQ